MSHLLKSPEHPAIPKTPLAGKLSPRCHRSLPEVKKSWEVMMSHDGETLSLLSRVVILVVLIPGSQKMVLVIIPLIELGRILNFIPYITETTRVFFHCSSICSQWLHPWKLTVSPLKMSRPGSLEEIGFGKQPPFIFRGELLDVGRVTSW